ncbi:MarR family winged helix-turn-helix transcriptional regulator [Nocardia sp. CA-120079]|uniref:MarR family winged helix-turn-helix transcriptional regulator n=1 Tax=Nocardia sp. CA-120079 TaxID=3239974 RepID=UPI003D98E6A3
MTTSQDQDLAAAFAALYREVGVLYGVISRRFGLTVQQVELLCLLYDRRPSFGELAGLLGCDKTNVTGMVDRLARRGLVARATDPDDRRITRAVLTDQGAAMRENFRSALAAELEARVPRANRSRLVALITDSVTALAETR